ncbi:serine hydrolase [Tsukamurella sp. PLM1]|uniref:serine hydrolase domain-containing protein n=1 Tax=Tsukamurella sp. PLM1 TaxID=2929795 RepID=UPI00204F8F53|nr:serine hydrolase domain-containing protein [Tsukamurella sp. PLM1]BDH56973.1 hypothetical protein MTP03_19120 [Tsukamurella sp. PLM1]
MRARWAVVGLIGLLTWAVTAGPVAAGTGVAVRTGHLLTDAGVPGYAVRIIRPDRIEEEAIGGVDGAGRPVTASTPFVWGSVSKSVAARTALGLAGRGALDLDAPVVAAVPAARDRLGDEVTVRDLIRHTSGLPHDVSVTDVARAGSASSTIGTMPVPARAPRGTFRYSSLNYVLLQAVIEASTGAPYSAAVESEVAVPAGAGIIADAATSASRVPPGHVPFFTRPRVTVPAFDGAGLAYGYLAGSVDALARYAQWLVRDEGGRDFPTVPTGRGADYGPGLYRETIAGREVWWHSGAVPGYFTHLAVFPESGRALVLVANRYGELESDRLAAVARHAMRAAAGDRTDPPDAGAGPSAVLVGTAAAAGLGAVAIGWATVRFARRRSAGTRAAGRTAFGVVLCGIAGATAWFGPASIGYPRPVLARWVPDVALLLTVLAAEAAALALLLLAGGVIRHREGRASRTGSACS